VLADAVLTDNFEAAFRATQHLIRQGHRRMAHLGDELTIATARERRRGFREALKAAGLASADGQHADNLRSAAEAFAAVQRLMRSPLAPTALFTSQNLVTVGAIRALHQLGLQHRVAMVGFDDLILADVLNPGITVIAQDPARIGALAAEWLFRRLDGDTSAEQTVIVPSRLITRGSGEIPPPE
jgi:LacI family transcriptional regulator